MKIATITKRHELIIYILNRCPASFKEIEIQLNHKSDPKEHDLNISKRTFQRDITAISEIHDIEIKYNNATGKYYIANENDTQVNNRLIEAYQIYAALNISKNAKKYIHVDSRRPEGTENLYDIIQAIDNHLTITFIYKKFFENESTERIVHPYAVKEFKNRWYVLAKDLKDGRVKTFGLDRISDLKIGKKQFTPDKDFDVNKYFEYCFGVITANGKKPEEVILSFNAFQGKYVKSLPFHESQEILVDNVDELRIKLKLAVTDDFTYEILQLGERVKVIQPLSLIHDLKEIYKKALAQYPD